MSSLNQDQPQSYFVDEDNVANTNTNDLLRELVRLAHMKDVREREYEVRDKARDVAERQISEATAKRSADGVVYAKRKDNRMYVLYAVLAIVWFMKTHVPSNMSIMPVPPKGDMLIQVAKLEKYAAIRWGIKLQYEHEWCNDINNATSYLEYHNYAIASGVKHTAVSLHDMYAIAEKVLIGNGGSGLMEMNKRDDLSSPPLRTSIIVTISSREQAIFPTSTSLGAVAFNTMTNAYETHITVSASLLHIASRFPHVLAALTKA